MKNKSDKKLIPAGFRICPSLFVAWVALMAAGLTAFAADVEIDTENRLIYKGDITAAANSQARELYNRATNPPERLVITSNGGPVLDGLELAEWVH